jgi:selenide,water dikinase
MIPGYVAGFYSKEDCHIDLVKLCAFANVRLIHAEVTGLNLTKKTILLKGNRPAIRYDIVSIDIGCTPKPFPFTFSPANELITAVKPINNFSDRWNRLLELIINSRIDSIQQSSVYRICVVGGGAGGVELALAIHHRVSTELVKIGKDPQKIQLQLIHKASRLLNTHNRSLSLINITFVINKSSFL